ncbi:MAG TPA: hypothetical protein VGT79_08810, partial [Xanthomonadaceae bacterium]|nr:hypothetical protein [Xanthomonadaceae bacterium]
MRIAFLLPLSLIAVTAAAQPSSLPTTPAPITIEQAMADPDWIGPPIDSAWWSWDSRRAYFPLKRNGGALKDLYGVDVSGGAPMT